MGKTIEQVREDFMGVRIENHSDIVKVFRGYRFKNKDEVIVSIEDKRYSYICYVNHVCAPNICLDVDDEGVAINSVIEY